MTKTLLILILILFSCKESTNSSLDSSKVRIPADDSLGKDSTIHTQKQLQKDSINITDSNDLKQGKWITKGYKNKVVKIETYKNDTLNGYWFNWEGMQEDGKYLNGKKDGYFRVYYGDKSKQEVMHLKRYQKDSLIWSACPAADSKSAIPLKGFDTNMDSILIQAPYVNGELWYKGLFIANKAKGIHSIFDRKGRLLARTNYADSTVTFTKHASDQFIETTKNSSNGWSFTHE
jgi:antitoxin component YwqK of YwqJK toxin-antitoxin module